jgi:tetrahydromethanopterin S-methyltransferase subunit F
MTYRSPTRTGPKSGHRATHDRRATTGWAGWVTFAGVLMLILGVSQALEGLVALFNSDYYVVGADGLAVNLDFTTWAWVHLLIGVAAAATGAGLLKGNMVARIVAVAIAVLSAIVNLMFLAAFPLWATVVITIDIIVIYAVVVHGHELKG